MTVSEVYRLLEEGESGRIEFKRRFSTPEKIAKEIVAFANTKGGTVLLGIDDDRSIIGVDSEKSEIEMMLRACEVSCEPSIDVDVEIVHIGSRDVVVIHVPESIAKPHVVLEADGNRQGYIRVADKSLPASREMMKVMKAYNPDAPALVVSIGEEERKLFAQLEITGKITLKQFSKLVNISERRASRILVQLVRAGVIVIHTFNKEDFYTLAEQ